MSKLLRRESKSPVTSGEEGVIEGYIAVWNTVDSYQSTFVKGAFSDTIKSRGDRVKVMSDHNSLIGKAISIEEDDHGVLVRGKINLDTSRGMDVFRLCQDGTYDGMSFAFSIPPGKSYTRNGIEYITGVELFEFGPVTFPANENAVIIGTRSADFNADFEEAVESGLGRVALYVLEQTLCDIRWSGESDMTIIVAKLDKAISDFHAAYITWAKDYFLDDPGADIFKLLSQLGMDDTDIVSTSPLTMEDMRSMRTGGYVEDYKLTQFPELLAHNKAVRMNTLERIFKEIRAGLQPAEKSRLLALLGADSEYKPSLDTRAKSSIREALAGLKLAFE